MQTLTTLSDVPLVQQTTNYSCGAATLKAVLSHYGEDVAEPKLMREVGVHPKTGSTAGQVATAARRRGYVAHERQFRSVDELAVFTDQDVPVIVAIQSFNNPNQGHFVVATKVKRGRVQIMDPNTRGNQRVLSTAEMDRRWQFRERVGVVIVPDPKRRGQFGGTSNRMSNEQTFAIVVAGLFAAASVVGAGVMIYRRRRAN